MITYNHSQYIEEAIESILRQEVTFDWELVVSNDASTDNTHEKITQIIEKYPQAPIRYFNHTSNLGMMNNFIFALKECTGTYIALCEGDDYWTDARKLKLQVDFLESKPEFAGVFHNTVFKDEISESAELNNWRSYQKSKFGIEDTISKVSLFHTSSFLFRKKFMDYPDWFKNVQSGDMALFSIVASRGPLYRIDKEMSVYRKNTGGITSTIQLKGYHKKRLYLFHNLKRYLNRSDLDPHFKSVLGYHKNELAALRKRNLKQKLKRLFKK